MTILDDIAAYKRHEIRRQGEDSVGRHRGAPVLPMRREASARAAGCPRRKSVG